MSPLHQDVITGFYVLQEVIQFPLVYKGLGTPAADCPVFNYNVFGFIGLGLAVVTVSCFIFAYKAAKEIVQYLPPSGLRIIIRIIGLHS